MVERQLDLFIGFISCSHLLTQEEDTIKESFFKKSDS